MSSTTTTTDTATTQPQLYTCISCAIAFLTPADQRTHYRSDHHRYNMKRRVASLPPVSATIFNEKVLAVRGGAAGGDKHEEDGAEEQQEGALGCKICGKSYASGNAYKSHLNSKKHKENEAKGVLPSSSTAKKTETPSMEVEQETPVATEEEELEQKVKKAEELASQINISKCLFCPFTPSTEESSDSISDSSLESTLAHMSLTHSFFLPDTTYLTSLSGLLTYLHQKISIGHTCLYCNASFRSDHGVKGHMKDKRHEMLAYTSEKEKLEVSDWYDFSSTYPSTEVKKTKVTAGDDVVMEGGENEEEEGDWESESEDSDDLEDPSKITYGDSPYELVLPSGVRIGHRSLKHYYTQNLTHSLASPSTAQRLLTLREKQDTVTRNPGMDVVAKRNGGEAREAGRHIREFRDMKRRENFKTKVGFRNNYQKHFRDPLLQ